MSFPGVLFRDAATTLPAEPVSEPAHFTDLNLDRVVAAITAGKEEYDLEPFFRWPLRDADDIAYRQEVMRDLEDPALRRDLEAFADSMRAMRQALDRAETLRDALQRQRWFLGAVDTYSDAVTQLARGLANAAPASRGLLAFKDHLDRYLGSARFVTLRERTQHLIAALLAIRYSLHIDGGTVEARRYAGEPDYGAEIAAAFARFRQGAVKGYAFRFPNTAEMNHVEAAILGLVAKLYPETFSELERYATEERDFADPAVVAFDRDIQFFIAYLDYIGRFRDAGLCFCYPRVGRDTKEVYDEQGFDLALADKLVGENRVPVCNDFHLRGRERMIVVSGPNQGGKTTFARTFGQLHYLAALGCPVPGARAQLFLFDRLFTHFERQENAASLRGKLQDDLFRIHNILEAATADSVVIMNEIFTSTTLRDATVLSRRIAGRVIDRGLLCVWVTFLDEIASLGPETVSMVSMVVTGNPAQRTYRIVRRPADGLAYALSVAEKHGLTSNRLARRLG